MSALHFRLNTAAWHSYFFTRLSCFAQKLSLNSFLKADYFLTFAATL